VEDPKYIGVDDAGRMLITVVLPCDGTRVLSLLLVYDYTRNEVLHSCVVNLPGDEQAKNINGYYSSGRAHLIYRWVERSSVLIDPLSCDATVERFNVSTPPSLVAVMTNHPVVHAPWRISSLDAAGGILKLHRKNRFTNEYTHMVCTFGYAHPLVTISDCSDIFRIAALGDAARLADARTLDPELPFWLLSPALDQIRYVSSATAAGGEAVRMSVNYGDCVQFECEYSRWELGLRGGGEAEDGTDPMGRIGNGGEGTFAEGDTMAPAGAGAGRWARRRRQGGGALRRMARRRPLLVP